MANDKKEDVGDRRWKKSVKGHGTSGGIYFLAFLGAAVYYISQATTFWLGVLGFLKALVWPALLIYNLLKFLQM